MVVFDQLPNEIVGEVLVSAVHSLPYDSGYRFPAAAMLVCRRWYFITLQTPRMWSIVLLTAKTTKHALVRIQRSGSVGLNVLALKMNPHPDSLALEEILLNCSSRWSRLEIHSQGHHDIWAISDILKTADAQRLRSLKIGTIYRGDGDAAADASFSVTTLGFDWRTFPSLASLVRLELRDKWRTPVSVEKFLDFLQVAQELEILLVDGMNISGYEPFDDGVWMKLLQSSPATPRLRSLTLRNIFVPVITLILATVTKSNLISLHLQFLDTPVNLPRWGSWNELWRMLRYPRLKKVHFTYKEQLDTSVWTIWHRTLVQNLPSSAVDVGISAGWVKNGKSVISLLSPHSRRDQKLPCQRTVRLGLKDYRLTLNIVKSWRALKNNFIIPFGAIAFANELELGKDGGLDAAKARLERLQRDAEVKVAFSDDLSKDDFLCFVTLEEAIKSDDPRVWKYLPPTMRQEAPILFLNSNQ